MRETLFNWLAPALPGAVCLDLFAGSGVLGFEALSRGAKKALLVERDARIASVLEQQARELGANAEIVSADARELVSRGHLGPFDVVFVDPPYSEPVEGVLAALVRLLTPGARLYLERRRLDPWPEVAGLEWIRRASAGSVDYGLARPTPASAPE